VEKRRISLRLEHEEGTSMNVKVLAVDDEADILRLIEIKLKKSNFEVFTARDGEEGLAKALAVKPDVVIADVMMPKKNGYEMVSEIRAGLGSQAPIVIMLTARGEAADMSQGLGSGADDYVVKPFSPRELVERIQVALLRQGKRASDQPGQAPV
jgi:two-component system, OmpR family, alkaline phosphatase synthesis response regulator PhoP